MKPEKAKTGHRRCLHRGYVAKFEKRSADFAAFMGRLEVAARESLAVAIVRAIVAEAWAEFLRDSKSAAP